MPEYRRRRFLTDLLFVGGALLAAAGLAAAGLAVVGEAPGDSAATPGTSATPAQPPTQTPAATPVQPRNTTPGLVLAPPPKPKKLNRDPFTSHQANYAPAGGMPPPDSRRRL